MKMKKRIAALLLAVVLVVSLTGCKDTLTGVAHKLMGTSDEVQEEDTTRWAEQTGDPLIIQGIADASAKFATATADGCLYAVFNGIWSRQTSYFTVPGGTLNIILWHRRGYPEVQDRPVEKRWTAAPVCRRAPTMSRPTAPTTAAPSRAGPGGSIG